MTTTPHLALRLPLATLLLCAPLPAPPPLPPGARPARAPDAGAEERFDALFTGRALRADLVHSGDAESEVVALRGLRLEGPWPGSPARLVDASGHGEYRFRLEPAGGGAPLYQRGFSGIFAEWQTTSEAEETARAFPAAVRFPEPREPARLVVERRVPGAGFRAVLTAPVDPASRAIDRSPLPAVDVVTLHAGGPPRETLDVLLLGDGYAAGEVERFHARARELADVLLATEPFRRRRGDVAVRAAVLPARTSGVRDPRRERWTAGPLGLSYDAFGSERYVLTFDERAVREVAAAAPYETLILLANDDKYGGGGIFETWCTVAAESRQAPYLVVHELGHSFAGLADEYYTSSTAYERLPPLEHEPWEPNVTALLDSAALKWSDLVAHGTPLPTPWDQARYDEVALALQERRAELREAGASEERMDAHFAEVKEATSALLSAEPHAGAVGAFEGGAYRAKGLYRPATDCIMFTRNPTSFCAVCERAVERAIDRWAE